LNKLLLFLLLTPLLFYGQKRYVSKLGVETIKYGDIAEYFYDGNPFNNNKKSLTIYFSNKWSSFYEKGFVGDIEISMSDISQEKVDVTSILLKSNDVRYLDIESKYQKYRVYKPETLGFYEFIFDNDKTTYFKLDSVSIKNLKSLDNELFMKFKKHKKAIIRWNYKKAKNGHKGRRGVKEVWAYIDYVINLSGFTAAYNKYMEVKSPTEKNKNLYKVSNGLANVNPFNLEKYIDKFILDAKINHNIDLSYVNKRDRLIIFRELKEKTIATAYKMNNDNEVFVKVDPENWYDANQAKRWYIIYHELGHDILNLEHGECGAMMDATTSGSYTWSRLEKDKNTMFNAYKKKK
jgi:hypothetical protein